MARKRKETAVPASDRTCVSIEVRKISNGWIVRKSTETSKGYKSTETFEKAKPTLKI